MDISNQGDTLGSCPYVLSTGEPCGHKAGHKTSHHSKDTMRRKDSKYNTSSKGLARMRRYQGTAKGMVSLMRNAAKRRKGISLEIHD